MGLNDGADKMEFFFYASPEELGKRQVGCTFCFTINTSETEVGLFSTVIMMGLYWHIHAGVTNCS